MANLTGYSLAPFVRVEVAPATGSTTVLAAPYDLLLFTNPGTIAAQSVTLPVSPTDGQIVIVSNFATITALTFSPAVAGWTNGSTLNAGNGLWLAYSAPSATWFVLNS